MKKTKKRGKEGRSFLDRLKNTNYIVSFSDYKFLLRCLLYDFGFFLIGIVGIFNATVFLISLVAKKPFAMAQTFVEVQKAEGTEAAFRILETLQPGQTMLTGLIFTIIISIAGFLLFIFALSFFKGLIYSSLTKTKLNKQYFLKFSLFNIVYYVVIFVLLYCIFKLFQLTVAVKILLAVILLYFYFTPFFRMHFKGKNIRLEFKTALRNALDFSAFLRTVIILLTFVVIALLMITLLPKILAVLLSVPLYYYMSAWSRNYLYKTVSGVER
ncbi:hypothetical protein KY325_02955 [Candidatus Woesearchaeota archaeon]|nr:hypothetical protein [Candidatus Woesearchaeota archaeon]MBW3018090.1 hypothetical protein [Candidatus Woesearchaeota archaeon]